MAAEQATDAIRWTGDLSDDCRAEYRGLRAHAEHMDRGHWYCSVWDPDRLDKLNYLFHSSDVGISLRSGTEARRLCEYLLRLFAGLKSDEVEDGRQST